MPDNPSSVANSAIKSAHDDRDIIQDEVAFSSSPFDWNAGYDGEADLSNHLGQVIKIPIKDQGDSGSCGGQAESYGGAVLTSIVARKFDERSAKFTYAPVSHPGGGSTGRDLSARAITAGFGLESLTPSYQSSHAPSEAFMERRQDITQAANNEAAKNKPTNYILVTPNIDSVAQAIRDYKFVRLGVVGSNNGTWRSADPKPPTNLEQHWYHWMCGLKAKMRNGKKAIGVLNSWGPLVGDNNDGWQWLNEDWFKAQLTNDRYGAVPIFEPRSYLWEQVPVPAVFHFVFNKDLQYGVSDPDVIQLQTALRIDGEFPTTIQYNEHFGPATLTAVKKFQVKYQISDASSAGFGRCGPRTRAKLNSLFGQ